MEIALKEYRTNFWPAAKHVRILIYFVLNSEKQLEKHTSFLFYHINILVFAVYIHLPFMSCVYITDDEQAVPRYHEFLH
jgi:hypothetical protein